MATQKITSTSGGSIAKIARPRITEAFLRSRLFSILDKQLDYPATWISAPAGSGKTTLAASYLIEKKLPAIWYQIDEGDADITTFFYYMGLAAPRRKKPLPLLTPEYLMGIDTFTLRYFENLYRRLKPPFLIVLDNYQLVPHTSMLHQVICAGIDAVPDGIKIVCISREDPPAQFTRLRANERLKLISSMEIRFTFEEFRGMMQMKGFEELPERTVQYIHERTGGWAAGLVLMMEGVRAKGLDSVQSDLTTEMVFDYFAEELFKKTNQEMRDFLVKTSFFPKMTASMAKELTRMADSDKKLARLSGSNFFTYKTVQSQPSYEYHPLFREFLQSRVEDFMTPEQVLEIRSASARILEQAGQVEDAVRLLLAAQDWENVAPMILSHGSAIVSQGRGKTLGEWLGSFPEDVLAHSPWLLYWLGVSHLNYSDKKAYGFFEKAFQLFESQDDLTGTLFAWSGAVDSLFNITDFTLFEPWARWLDTRIDQGLVFPSSELEAQIAASMAGALVWGFPRRDDVGEWLDRALNLSLGIGDIRLALQTYHNIIGYYYCTGDIEEMEKTALRMMGMIPEQESTPLSRIYSELSYALSIAMNTSPVGENQEFQHVEKGLAIANESGVHVRDGMLWIIGIMIAFDFGDMAAADEYFNRLERVLEEMPQDIVVRYLGLSIWRHFLKGDIDRALKIFEEIPLLDFFNNFYLIEYTRATFLLKLKRYEEALHAVQTARELIPKAGKGYYWDYLCGLVETSIEEGMGRENRVLECLGKAMTIARKQNYMSIYFLWQPHLLAHLCARALENGIEVEHVREMIRALDLPPEKASMLSETWPWPVRIYTLGKFEIYRDGNLISFYKKAPKKPLQLLMAIISMGGRDVNKEQIEDFLWPDADGDMAQAVFKTTLARLRSLLGKEQAIVVKQGRISLNPKYCWVDAWVFNTIADKITSKKIHPGSNIRTLDSPDVISLAEKAINLYGGRFLAGEDESDWAISYREHLLDTFCNLILLLGAQLEKVGKVDQAATCYRNAIDCDEIFDEEVYRRLISHYNQKGQSWNAMQVYGRLKRTFASKYGTEPSFRMDVT